ncbi:hypothetical protein BHE74_00054999 [Ensete ventricosum]|nr:hypothetical protein GW17_00059909 [Ensete ventricosum]RWW39654.1 hypothetical protein BHE74_00054999 [Ensete ventricosum]
MIRSTRATTALHSLHTTLRRMTYLGFIRIKIDSTISIGMHLVGVASASTSLSWFLSVAVANLRWKRKA